MAERIPGAELMIVPEGTHTAPLEYQELVELRVERFLRDRLGIRSPAEPSPAPRLGKRPGGPGGLLEQAC